MTEKIFLLQNDGTLNEMNEALYESEKLLQELLEKYPDLIDGEQINNSNPRRWLFITREKSLASSDSGVRRWAVDHLFIDQDGIPTIVEVKRSTDTRIRREVVGQMLEYASNAVSYWSVDDLRIQYETGIGNSELTPEIALQHSLGIEIGYDAFWDMVNTNLKAGRVRLLFVADSIPAELRRIIEFLNEQMNQAEVLGVEIKQFTSGELKTLVPKVIGQTSNALGLRKTGSQKRQWDEQSFFDELRKRCGMESEKTARTIYEWAKLRVTRIWFGQGKTSGSFVPIMNVNGNDHQAFAVYTYGTIEIYFYWYMFKPTFNSPEKRKELLHRLNAIKEISIPEDKIDKRPGVTLSSLSGVDEIQQFLGVFEWYLEEIKAVKQGS